MPRDKHRFNRWGKLKIGQMLRQKHIADTIIDEALATLPEEQSDTICLSLLQQKNKSLKEDDLYKRKQSFFRFALSRGFVTRPLVDAFVSCWDEFIPCH